MKKITIVIEEDGQQFVGHLELTKEIETHFDNIGISAIEDSIVETIRRMLETSKDRKNE